MLTTTLGRTGFHVTRMGLGCGGHSRLGLSQGHSPAEAERVVQEALEYGINFVDTAESYGTEEVVGRAIGSYNRDSLIVSTKFGVDGKEGRMQPSEVETRLDGCLKRLRTDYVDILHLHGVSADEYPYAAEVLGPALGQLKDKGKVRAIGITEAFAPDPAHQMLSLAVMDDVWDVMMVGFNLLNPSARERVLQATQRRSVGTLCMFAVRRALSQPEALREVVGKLIAEGVVEAGEIDAKDPLGFLVTERTASSVQEAAYRFCLWEPGIDVVLTGTGNLNHLRQNIGYAELPPLPSATVERLTRLFGRVDSVSGN